MMIVFIMEAEVFAHPDGLCVCVNGPAVKRFAVCSRVLIIERFHTFSRTVCKSPVITTYVSASNVPRTFIRALYKYVRIYICWDGSAEYAVRLSRTSV